jgi:hypothetical protein
MECWNNGLKTHNFCVWIKGFGINSYITGQNVKGNRVLPYPELLKPPIDVFSIHDVVISQIVLFFNDTEDKPNMSADASLRAQYSNIPVFSPPGGGDERSELSSEARLSQ